jgi:integrase
MSDLAPLLQGFFTDKLMLQRQASPNTVAAYRDTFTLLLGFVHTRTGRHPAQLSVADLDAPTIGKFLQHLETSRGSTASTRNARLAAIHSFFHYALRVPEHTALIQRVLSIPPKRFDRAIVNFLTRSETDALIAAPDKTIWTGLRDHALLLVAVHTGLGIYGAEYRGIVDYYLLAHDIRRLNRLHWAMETSMLKTLAGKHKSTVAKMARRHKRTVDTSEGPRTCFEAAAARAGRQTTGCTIWWNLGGIPLKRQRSAVIPDRRVLPVAARRKQLITRLAGTCGVCGSTQDIQVHQVRKLADLTRLGGPRPTWAQLMAKRRRKTLVVCPSCHGQIHAHQPTATITT